jgi:sugar phosphate permease
MSGISGEAGGSKLGAALSSRRWKVIVPISFITYSLAYLDRSNYSLGTAGGLAKDLHITPGVDALLGALFFLGYFLFQIPAAHYAENKSVKRLIFWCLIFWGIFAAAQGVIPWLWLFFIDRFLLGVVEAAILPAMLIFLAHWFTSRERARANSFLILGNPVTVMWMSAVSGYLIAATSWRWMFIIEGLPAVLWAFVFWRLTADHPKDAGWLDQKEKDAIEGALAEEQREIPPVSTYREALGSRNVIVLAIQYLLWSIGVYGFVFWLPTIIKAASHHGIGSTGVLSAVPYAFAVIAMIIVSYLSDRSSRRRVFVWPFLLAGTIAFYLSYKVGPGHFWFSFVLLVIAGAVMYAPYGPYFAFIPEMLPRNVSGAAIALVNSFGALGGFVGAYVVGWLNGNLGSGVAFVFMAAALLAAALLMLLVRRPRPGRREPVTAVPGT